tara:strand:- start:349 stop:540 length:192 start_codon:yes stop_codon:yes gene_type:complete
MIIKLTKKEKEFLVDWLSDDLDIQLKNYYVKESDTIVKPLRSIIKKLTKKQRSQKWVDTIKET